MPDPLTEDASMKKIFPNVTSSDPVVQRARRALRRWAIGAVIGLLAAVGLPAFGIASWTVPAILLGMVLAWTVIFGLVFWLINRAPDRDHRPNTDPAIPVGRWLNGLTTWQIAAKLRAPDDVVEHRLRAAAIAGYVEQRDHERWWVR